MRYDMTFKKYLEHLNQLAKDNPELLDVPVVYAGDDEGNYYDEVFYSPSLQHMDKNGDVHNVGSGTPANVVCLN